MGKLVNVGTGEILDRISILSLKVLHAPDAVHFRTERNALLSKLREKNSFDRWFEEYLQLGAVNAALWYAEDELRELRAVYPGLERAQGDGIQITEPLQRVAQCAFRIQSLNDQRSQLIAAINQKTGEFLGQEKL